MAKYTVDHACGHQSRVDLIGKHTTREWRLEKMAAQDCTECYRLAKAERAAEVSAALDLPLLLGSEKQIAWAETIRAGKITAIQAALHECEHFLTEPGISEEVTRQWAERAALLRAKLAAAREQTSAKYWIDHR